MFFKLLLNLALAFFEGVSCVLFLFAAIFPDSFALRLCFFLHVFKLFVHFLLESGLHLLVVLCGEFNPELHFYRSRIDSELPVNCRERCFFFCLRLGECLLKVALCGLDPSALET